MDLIMMATESQILPTMTIQFIDLTVQLIQRQHEQGELQQPLVLDLVLIIVTKLFRKITCKTIEMIMRYMIDLL